MKLVLCSEGFRTPNTVQACVELVSKPQQEITIAVINEAYAVEGGDKRWVFNNLNDVASNFSAELDLINLLALPIEEVKQRILAKDVLFVVGGNMDYQMQLFTKSGFAEILPELLETIVYVGSSAGSIVLGKRLPLEAYAKVFGPRKDIGVHEFMGLVDFAIMPHMNSLGFPENRPEVLQEAAKGTSFPVYGLQDDSTIVIDGDRQRFIGSEPYKVR